MKLLTVTIPCYNSQDYMEHCISSLMKGGDRVQIIIIDDGSRDKTGDIADKYAAEYPDMIKAVHQPNGGHGEGINAGIRNADGKYFKVVDSDDWVSDDFPAFLDALEQHDAEGGADLIVTNYYYEHADGKGNRSICYSNIFPENVIHGWDKTKSFRIHQLLTIHSCTFRTSVFKEYGKELPKHIFYEDNLMVYQLLPYCKKLLYLNMDLYRYFIGREGQSVQKDVMMGRYEHQLIVSQRCFEVVHLDDIAEPRLRKYLDHELFMMFGISTLYARLNRSDEADKRLKQMWDDCIRYDEKWAKKYRYRSALRLVCIRGRFGRDISCASYAVANKVVRFN